MVEKRQGNVLAVAEDKLDRLLRAYGVEREFIEFSGNVARIPLENRLRILAALGLEPRNEADVDQLLREDAARHWKQWVESVVLLHLPQPCLPLALREGEEGIRLHWRIDLEEGGCLEGDFLPADFAPSESHECQDGRFTRRRIPLPALPAGYHDLHLRAGERAQSCRLIAAPPRCHEPDWLKADRRLWGISVQLYSVCSERDWGIGDFHELRNVIELSAAQGADFILLNPFHALDIQYPENASPYSPVDRRFLNPLYIDIPAEPDFEGAEQVPALREDPAFKAALEALRRKSEVDYPGVFRLKYQAFGLMYRHFQAEHLGKGSPRAEAFQRFQDENGEILATFARFQAAIGVAGAEAGSEPGFHAYLQWLAQSQLEACQALALEKGMKVGLIRDLAIGGGTESCEVRSNPELFCLEARIGAPPDNFNPDGQNWGLPPMRPDVLKQTAFSHYVTLLRQNMKDCGALRIDHVIGLMRLWWCPTDGTNASGAYVHYPVEELFAILRLESQRARCLVIGEDLGVVPPAIRRYIDESGLLSNVIFYFEKYDGWHFKKPEHYPHRALAIIANHDVPTLKGWWDMSDLVLRRQLGLITSDEQLARDREYRRNEKYQVLEWLAGQQMLPAEWWDRRVEKPFDTNLASAIIRCCGSASSLLVSVQLDDLAGMEKPVNIPGIGSEYPNWRRRIPVPMDELFDREDTRRMLAGLQQERP